jgi:hypothetical protein
MRGGLGNLMKQARQSQDGLAHLSGGMDLPAWLKPAV